MINIKDIFNKKKIKELSERVEFLEEVLCPNDCHKFNTIESNYKFLRGSNGKNDLIIGYTYKCSVCGKLKYVEKES